MAMEIFPPIEVEQELDIKGIQTGLYTVQAYNLRDTHAGFHVKFKFVDRPDLSDFHLTKFYYISDKDKTRSHLGRLNLARLSEACGIKSLTNTRQLLDKPVKAFVDRRNVLLNRHGKKIKERRIEIVGFYSLDKFEGGNK